MHIFNDAGMSSVHSAELIAALIAENEALKLRVEELESSAPRQRAGGEDKGALSRMVEDLVLNTTLSYSAIVEQVLEAHPAARTTTRSVASVACVLRRTHEVPYRGRQN